MTEKQNLYDRVTSRIVQQLEQGVKPWLKPWNAEHAAGRITRPLRSNGEAYNGINILTLWDAAEAAGYACPIWLTFAQALDLGGNVRKGEKSSRVVYANTFTKTETNDAGDTAQMKIPFLKEYCVFNAEQCDNLPPEFSELKNEPAQLVEKLANVEEFVSHTGATFEPSGDMAAYCIGRDVIKMPRVECFRDAESYHATQLHELAHWTRHESRLNRDFGRKRFGDAGYAMEELVAELASAFLSADLAICPAEREDHAASIGGWIQVLKNDNKAIFTAASYASKACEFMNARQPQPAALCELG